MTEMISFSSPVCVGLHEKHTNRRKRIRSNTEDFENLEVMFVILQLPEEIRSLIERFCVGSLLVVSMQSIGTRAEKL